MKATLIVFIFTLASAVDASLSYYPLQSSDALLPRLFDEEDVRASSITPSELDILDKIIKTEFPNIGDSLQLPDSLTIDEYHYQLVTVLNSADQKLVFVNAVSKSLPSWMLSSVSNELLFYKCLHNQLFHFEVNLDMRLYHRLWNMDCH